MKNFSVTDSEGRVHNIVADKRPTKEELKARGFADDVKLSPEIPPPPPPTLTAEEVEAARLNTLSRAEFKADILAAVAAMIKGKP
jgi:hypothetical protein